MKNKIKFLATMLMGVMLSTNVWGTTYTKVTTVADGVYIIVNEASGRVFNGVDAVSDYVECTISDGKITDEEGNLAACEVTIAAMDGGYSIKINNGDKADNYISGKSGNNTIVYETTAVANEITFSDGAATILSNSTSFRYNATSGQDRFRYYKTTTTGDSYILPALYKKEPDCTTDLVTPVVTATPGNGSATLTWGAVANATSYTVTCAGATIGSITGEGTKTCTLTDLTNGTQYTWKVKAIGGGEYCDSEEATGNVTPSANHTVTWYVDGFVYTTGSPTTEVVHGGKVTELPTPPDVPDACTGSVFVGWTDHTVTNGNKPSPLFKDAASAPVVNANVNYHAVFADPE